ncbi:hypothetical protein MNBD_IGNAVI01-2561 [hydrothermal vent metagenome]|uniref:Uncharacterized protein n=1 Tax=hydrothermal vent metagenome TaxID=652676 RepID=A0A3B1BVW2_9ZZZZ
MFEKEIEFIYNYYLNKIEKLNSFVTFDQLASANLHPALLQYVSAEIDYLISEDRQKLLKESLFDYSGDKINEYFTKISEEIKLTKKFSKDYISKLLLHATSFNVNYVVRPNWSLVQFIFENEDEKHVSEIKQILNYLYYYPYYKRILTNYFNKKHLYKISEEELSEVLDKIDQINLENNFEEIVNESLYNIVDFINIGEVDNNRISKDVIEHFLIDKNIEEPSRILDEKLTGSSDDKFKIEEYREVILALHDKEEEQTVRTEEEGQVEQSEEEVQPNEGNLDVEEEVSTEDEIIIEENELENENLEEEFEIDNEISKQTELEEVDKEIEELIDENEFEPPELDEDARIEDTDVQEVYDMVIEEEEIEEVELEEPSTGERLNISEDETADSYLKELDELEERIKPEVKEEIEEKDDAGLADEGEENYVVHGSSVSFTDDDFGIDESSKHTENTEKSSPSKLEDLWDDDISMPEEPVQENLIFDDTEEDNDQDDNIEPEEHNTGEIQQPQVVKRNIDIGELLKNKKITKIIENIFDYDVDAFEKTIEKISECKFEVEALQIIDDIARSSYLDESSKEIKTFKKIISDLF